MLSLQVDKIGELAVVECEGSIAEAAEAARLSAAVLSQDWARVIMIDLSEVEYLEMDAVEVLAFLQRWARESAIQLKLFTLLPLCVISSRASMRVFTLNSLHYKRRWIC